jgi:hypothetical protein
MDEHSPRPLLLPAFPLLWRDAHTLQVGADPARAMVMSGLPRGTAGLLTLLDGQLTERELLDNAALYGMSATELTEILAALRRSGALVYRDPAAELPDTLPERARRRLACDLSALSLSTSGPHDAGVLLAARARRRVVIRGGGRLAVPLAALLGASGIGRVHVDTSGTVTAEEVAVGGHRPDDEHRPRANAAADAIRIVSPEVDTRPLPSRLSPDLVVLTQPMRPPVVEALTPEARRTPHLCLSVRGAIAIVGPLVVPGITACLNCIHLHRCDRDPAWPALAAQLATNPSERTICESALAAAASALAALQVLCHLDGGRPESTSASLELAAPGGVIRRRSWLPHPRCGCDRLGLAAAG